MFNWRDYQRTNIQAVDMCAAAIVAHRVKSLPLKAIHLWPDMYKQFKGWAEKLAGREFSDNELLEFDGVNIEMGTRKQSTPLLIELYTSDRVVTDFEKYLQRKKIVV